MKRNQIIAIVVVAALAIAIPLIFVFMTPPPAGNVIRIGLLDDLNDITGQHAEEGAKLAIKEINAAGGVMINDTAYTLKLASEDTKEAEGVFDLSNGITAAEKLLSTFDPHVVLGGYRTEMLTAYIETIMDAKIPFMISGSATDNFTQNVLDNYDKYKYTFRCMPPNSTEMGTETIYALVVQIATLSAMTGKNITKIGLIYEDLDWTDTYVKAMKDNLPYLHLAPGSPLQEPLEIVGEIGYPITSTPENFNTYWQDLDDNGTQVAVTIVSGATGVLLTKAYGVTQPKMLALGVNVPAQLDTFWDDTEGAANTSVIVQTAYNATTSTKSLAFWAAFLDEYDHEPLYTAVGSYDAVYAYARAIGEANSLDADDIVAALENIDVDDPNPGAGGNLAFTSSHDVFAGAGFSTIFFCQWQEGGTKVILSSGGLIWPDSVGVGPLVLPPYGIN
jgi:branched-chain amino acid transport system substrate-binding protein